MQTGSALHGRTYDFARDSAKVARLSNVFRRICRTGVVEPWPNSPTPSFVQVIGPERLLATFMRLRDENGQAPGIDGIRYTDLSVREVGAAMRAVSRELSAGTYVPSPTRPKVIQKHVGLRKKLGAQSTTKNTRTLQIGTVVDRTVAAAVAEEITLYLDSKFLPISFAFRPGYNTWQALLSVDETFRRNDLPFLTIDDVRQAFDFVPIDELLKVVRANIADERLVDLIERIVRGYQGKNRIVGIDQGSPLSPVLLNLLFCERLDRPFSIAAPAQPAFRYADNLAWLTKTVDEGVRMPTKAGELLAALGMELKGGEQPTNLRRQGAGVDLLGFRIQAQGEGLSFGLEPSAWRKFRDTLCTAQREPNPTRVTRAAIKGWLVAHAPAFENADVFQVLEQTLRQAREAGVWELGPLGECGDALQGAIACWRDLSLACRSIPEDLRGHMDVCKAVHACASRASTRVPVPGYAPSLPKRKSGGRFFF